MFQTFPLFGDAYYRWYPSGQRPWIYPVLGVCQRHAPSGWSKAASVCGRHRGFCFGAECKLCGRHDPDPTRRVCRVWAESWSVAVYATKSTAVIFSWRRNRPRPLTVGPAELPWTKSVKYLELRVDSRLNWRTHVRVDGNYLRLSLVGLLCTLS